MTRFSSDVRLFGFALSGAALQACSLLSLCLARSGLGFTSVSGLLAKQGDGGLVMQVSFFSVVTERFTGALTGMLNSSSLRFPKISAGGT